MTHLNAVLLALATLLPLPALAEQYLLMAEEDGCYWCQRWDEEISAIYPKTDEGKLLPLRRYDLHGDAPDNVELVRRVSFTPTFILIQDGQELGRIEGYPGEDFFWGLLDMMITEAGIGPDQTG